MVLAAYHQLCWSHILEYSLWPESYETSNMIANFWEGFFEIFVIFQVLYFSLQLCHILWHHAKVFHCFYHFWISYACFKLWSKRRAWRFLARGWASLNLQWISDEIAYYEPKKYFYKKSWALDHVPVVQIWPTSYRFGRNLCFLRGVDGKV